MCFKIAFMILQFIKQTRTKKLECLNRKLTSLDLIMATKPSGQKQNKHVRIEKAIRFGGGGP